MLLFVLGLASLGAGGVLLRRVGRRGFAAAAHHEEKAAYRQEIQTLRSRVIELDDAKEALGAEDLRDRIGKLLAEEYFDLTSKSDDVIALLGFNDYAKVWEGVATAERLLARCWSMCTDGHPEEGRAELPHARASLEQAANAMASV